MDINDLITISMILCDVDPSQINKDKRKAFFIGYGYFKAFIDCYYDYLAVIDIDLAIAINETSKGTKYLVKVWKDLEKFEDGEIIQKPFGVIFQGKKKKGEFMKYLF